MKRISAVIASVIISAATLTAPLPAIAADVQVSVFNYPNLNGTGTSCGTENANLIGIVDAIPGYEVDGTIDDFADPNLASQLSASEFFFMTDMENQNPTSTSFFPTTARSVLRDWVNAGGVMVMTGTYGDSDTTFLNLIFGWDLSTTAGTTYSALTANTAGTPFARYAGTLAPHSATDSISKGTVAGFTTMWGTDTQAAVAVIPYGAGNVIFMGWDFYDSGPGCGQYNDPWVQQIVPAALDYAVALSSAALANGTSTGGDLSYSVSQSGSLHWMVVPQAAAAPTAAQLKAQVSYSGVTPIAQGTDTIAANVAKTITLNTLTPATEYTAHLVTEYDDNGTPTFTTVQSVTFSTLPGLPVVNSVTSGNGKVTIDISPFGTETNFEYSLDGGTNWTARTAASVSSPWEITGLANGTAYDLKFRSVFDNLRGAATATFTRTPAAIAAPIISNLGVIDPFITGRTLTIAPPANAGGQVATWSISPALPTGLSLDTTSGEITGAFAADFAVAEFTLTATNAGGADTATFSISSFTPDPTYRGPLIETASLTSGAIGRLLEVTGQRFETITGATVDGKPCVVQILGSGRVLLLLPEGLTPGVKNLLVTSAYGQLTHQSLFTIPGELNGITPLKIARISEYKQSQYKLYAFDVVGAGKIQFFQNGKEVGWIRASSEMDPKLENQSYFVRSITLQKGLNRLEVRVLGKLVRKLEVTK